MGLFDRDRTPEKHRHGSSLKRHEGRKDHYKKPPMPSPNRNKHRRPRRNSPFRNERARDDGRRGERQPEGTSRSNRRSSPAPEKNRNVPRSPPKRSIVKEDLRRLKAEPRIIFKDLVVEKDQKPQAPRHNAQYQGRQASSQPDQQYAEAQPQYGYQQPCPVQGAPASGHRPTNYAQPPYPQQSHQQSTVPISQVQYPDDDRSQPTQQRPDNYRQAYGRSNDVRYQESGQSSTVPRSSNAEPEVSIDDLLEVMHVPRGWKRECWEDAKAFERSLKPDTAKQLTYARSKNLWKDWILKSDSGTLMVQTSSRASNSERFSLLSPFVANASKKLSERNDTFSLEFFCGYYKAASDDPGAFDIAVLFSFCHQLLNRQDLRIDDVCYEFKVTDLAKLEEGNIDMLQRLFKSLVKRLSKTHGRLVCCIDGVHLFEDDRDGIGWLEDLLDHFEDCVNDTDGLELKVLLTLPQDYSEEWRQLTRDRMSVLQLEDSEG